MVSPRTPTGKRDGPSEQEGKWSVVREYVDPFEQYDERVEVVSEGWISWARSGVVRGLEGASNVMGRAASYTRGTRQQDIPLEVSQGGGSLDFDDFNDSYNVREEAQLAHNIPAAFRNTEARGDSNVGITEAQHAAWKRREAQEGQKTTPPLPSRSAPGILVPGQGFVPIGGNSAPAPVSAPSAHSQNVPFPQPSIPNLPSSLIPGAGRSTSSFHYASTTPTRRNMGATSRATGSGSDS